MINSLREWLDKPIPDSKEGIQPWLDEIRVIFPDATLKNHFISY
jgi:hypothetical protein